MKWNLVGSIYGNIFASQGLRSALLIFTLGIVRRIFVIPAHCYLLDFDSYAPCNDVIFSQSKWGFHFLSFECPENWLEIIMGSVSSYKLFYTIKIVPDWRFFAFLFCWHFSYRTCAFCKARSDWLQLPLAALHINRHCVTSKIRLNDAKGEDE